ncbi:MAG TPA: hypothetical protein VFP95_04400 [Gammaproteobacteria bacterium]|nr:hypothetical protein [Gammaproteobacteria bacterium]
MAFRNYCFLFAILCASGCTAIPPERSYAEYYRASVIGFDELNKNSAVKLDTAISQSIALRDKTILTEKGPSHFALLKLPTISDSYVLGVQAWLDSNMYVGLSPAAYAPELLLFDEQMRPIAAFMEDPAFQRSAWGAFLYREILVPPKARYALIYTNPQLIGFDEIFAGTHKPEQLPETLPIPIVTPAYKWPPGVRYTPRGEVILNVPGIDDYRFVKRTRGWLFELGSGFGGERLTTASADSDSIHAGAGSFMSLSYAWPLDDNAHWAILLGSGFLYQAADTPDGRAVIKAWTVESTVAYTTAHFRFRLGIAGDLSPQFNSPLAGQDQEFDTTFGPVALIEYRIDKEISIGLRFEALEYKDQNTGQTIDASTIGLTVGVMF